jgi:aspartyl protease family protein
MIPTPGSHPTLYAVAAAIIVVTIVARRIPVLRTIVSIASWGAILVLLVTVLNQRQDFDPWLGGVARYFKLEDQSVLGQETRIRMSPDGHFWIRARFGGIERRMLVDSGATVTALSSQTAAAADLRAEDGIVPVLLTTANGTVRARSATIPEFRFGNIVARDLPAVVSPAFGDVNVVGMNFLSRLKSWRVEERTLILVPHHPQDVGGGKTDKGKPAPLS